MCNLTFLREAWNMEIAVEAGVDPQLALGHTELLQVPVQGEGLGPVQTDDCQVAAHREGRHILGGWMERDREGTQQNDQTCFIFLILAGSVEGLEKGVTFAECGNSRPVGGSAAHFIEAGSSQLIGGVRLETCTE